MSLEAPTYNIKSRFYDDEVVRQVEGSSGSRLQSLGMPVRLTPTSERFLRHRSLYSESDDPARLVMTDWFMQRS